MQPDTTTPVGTPIETVTIRVAPKGGHFIAQWSAGWIGGRDFRGETVDGIIATVLDSIWEEGTRARGRGRPSRRSTKIRRLVRSWVRVVIEIEPLQHGWPTTRSDRVH